MALNPLQLLNDENGILIVRYIVCENQMHFNKALGLDLAYRGVLFFAPLSTCHCRLSCHFNVQRCFIRYNTPNLFSSTYFTCSHRMLTLPTLSSGSDHFSRFHCSWWELCFLWILLFTSGRFRK